MLTGALRDGAALLTWRMDTFGYAESFDEGAGRYLGLRAGEQVAVTPDDAGLIVRPDIAQQQRDAEALEPEPAAPSDHSTPSDPHPSTAHGEQPPLLPQDSAAPRRYHGTVQLDPARVGRDASQIAEEIIAHLVGLAGSEVTVTLDIEARLPDGASEHVLRTVTENGRELRFDPGSGFEQD